MKEERMKEERNEVPCKDIFQKALESFRGL